MSAGAPITANLLTGFLGAGKTSLLKRLLRRPDLKNTAVLINEFGEIGLDHFLIEEVDEDIVLLKSGCVCCTIRGDLKDALTRLFERRQRREIPPFSRLVIETTGLADPAPIVATLTADPMLRHQFRMGNVLTVVDAVAGAKNLDTYPESLRQAAAADRLLISKTDLASAKTVAALREKLTAINPAAGILETTEDDDPASTLLTDDVHDDAARAREVRRWLAASDHVSGHEHSHGDPNRHGNIRAFVLTAQAPLDWARFGLWLSMLLNRYGTQILRLKGLVAIEGQDTPVVIQGVQHLIHKPMHLSWPDADRRTRLVVIADKLDPALVQRSFAAFTNPQKRRARTAA